MPDEEDPDYDLSEAAGYAGWDAPGHRGPMPEWVITTIAVVLILAIVLGIVATVRWGFSPTAPVSGTRRRDRCRGALVDE